MGLKKQSCQVQSDLEVSFTPLFRAGFLWVKKVTRNSSFTILALQFLPHYQNEKENMETRSDPACN